MAYSTILVAYYIKIITFKMTGFPIIIIYKIKTVSFKITGFSIAAIKLKGFLKRIINIYIASG